MDETLDAKKSWKDISDMQDALSLGIAFFEDRTIARREVFYAPANFCGEDPVYSFRGGGVDRDPHTSRDELYPGRFRVRTSFGPSDTSSAEVTHENVLQAAYDEARRLGRTFREQADAEHYAMLRGVLGPLADPNFTAELARTQADLLSAHWNPGPGTPISRVVSPAASGTRARSDSRWPGWSARY